MRKQRGGIKKRAPQPQQAVPNQPLKTPPSMPSEAAAYTAACAGAAPPAVAPITSEAEVGGHCVTDDLTTAAALDASIAANQLIADLTAGPTTADLAHAALAAFHASTVTKL